MLEIVNISKTYKPTNNILVKVNLAVKPGNICCLLGKNGVGKSTLINIIAGNTKQDAGDVFINNIRLNDNFLYKKHGISILSQYDNIINELSGYQFLIFQGLLLEIDRAILKPRIDSLVKYFFEDENDIFKVASSYSTGMRMKLRIISCLLNNPNVLIMDEPFANLDILSSQKLALLLNNFIFKEDHLVLISSHDLIWVDKIATQICVLDKAAIVFDGSKSEFTKNNTLKIDQTLYEIINQENVSTTSISWLF